MEMIKTETPSSNERSAYWDNIKGFLILLVVFAHVLFQLQEKSNIINTTVDYIYMFHMPAFIFISGFFGKSERSHSFESIIKLVFLYFIFNSIMGFLYGFTSLLQPMYSYWYLIALIAWRMTARHIAGLKEHCLIVFTAALLIGFFPSVDNTFAAARIIGFYPYYLLGYQLSQEKSATLQDKPYVKRASVGLLTLFGTGALAFGAYHYFNYSDDALLMASYNSIADLLGRVALFLIAFLAIYALRCLSPDRKIPFLTLFGRNSLWIFVFHRLFTLVLSSHIYKLSVPVILLIAFLTSFMLCILFGNEFVSRHMNRFLSNGADIFLSNSRKLNFSKIAAFCISLCFIVSVVFNTDIDLSLNDLKKAGFKMSNTASVENGGDVSFPVMSEAQKKAFDNAFRITFAGDLILLEDQVKRAYRENGYDFSDMFESAEPYISSADFAIGVFEGPMAGPEAGYSSGNFDDNKELYLNFPDAFASCIKDAGFDLVTTANNHLLDKGKEGALRTIRILDKVGLDHTGSYKSTVDKQKNRIKLIECQGIKIAVLSYTYGSNYIENSELIDGEYAYITSLISGTGGKNFRKLKERVEEDFREAKALSPDLILVLPHIGTQFSNEPDAEQKVWFDLFKENGADIILGDHPHAVEPALLETYNGRTVFTAYCPGNFANLYRENQGDTSMLTDVYIDRTTKKVIGGSIVPLYTYAPADGNYRAVPIFEIAADPELRKQLTTDDIERAADANSTITEVVFGHKMDISSLTERYYFNQNGFVRSKASGLVLTDEMRSGALYQAMDKAGSVCFIGDSVTEGTKNGGCPWYEPIEEFFPSKTIFNYSKGGCTVSYMIKHADEIPEADLYVVALGTNDIRYRDKKACAMTAGSYKEAINDLKNKLCAKSANAAFVFIAPWYSTDGDPFCELTYSEKNALNETYCAALKLYCAEHACKFINANGYIQNILKEYPCAEYLLDHIHPNAAKGVVMYSEAVLLSGQN